MTFVTLFLGLVTGPQVVGLAVDGPVARVELYLDHEMVGAAEGRPWTVGCDFGERITPHELVAVAFHADGRELHRAKQVVNLPRPSAEIHVAFETGDDGMPSAANLIWETADTSEPLSVFAILDGQYLIPERVGRYPLPDYDPTRIHILSAEARFANEITARTDVTFGGQYGSRIHTELTAVPIVVDGEPPRVEDMSGAFSVRGQPLRVAVVERPRGQIFMVRDLATLPRMGHLRNRQDRTLSYPSGRLGLSNLKEPRPDEDRIHAVVPNPVRRGDRQLYPTSPAIGLEHWPLEWLATRLVGDDAALAGQRLGDAVAVAGVQAAAAGTPRAVLAIISSTPNDAGAFPIQEIRHYLEQIRVPFYVWSVGGSAPLAWGPAREVSRLRDLRSASRALLRELDQQWIAWVEGTHMVNQIELSADITGIRLAGVPPEAVSREP